MARVEFIFSRGFTLEYVVNNTKAASAWIAMLSQMQPRYLLWNKQNSQHGFAGQVEIDRNLNRLRQVASMLGFAMAKLDRENWQVELNRLHIHFPACTGRLLTRREIHLYHELNLTIHWLEYELANFYNGREQYLINIDFNHYPPAYNLKQPFDEAELPLYSPTLDFGSLHLHYIYIGRHFLEMADANDFDSPADHFKSQLEFNATCGMVFSEPQDYESVLKRLKDYFERRGGKAFFGYSFDDSRLAKGFFSVAKLVNLNEFKSRAGRDLLREKVRRRRILGWKIHAN